MKEQNKWEQLFDQFMEMIEFGLIKYGDNNWGAKDRQEANLGDIESDRFCNAMQVIDRMDIYIGDYFLEDIDNLLAEKGIEVDWEFTCEAYLKNAKDLLPDAAWDFEVLDMICNHTEEIDLNNCCYEEEEE